MVLIVVDTLRADLGKSIEDVATPAIDALSADGVAFRAAFSHAPMTLPAHASLFSSRPPHLNGLVANEQLVVPADLPLLAEHLSGYGYATRAVVSLWTMGGHDTPSSFERGFDVYDRDYFGLVAQAPLTHERLVPALDALEEDERPFFLFAHFSDPHFPYNAHDPPAGRMVELLFDGERVAEFDASNVVLWEKTFELAPGAHSLELVSEHTFTLSHEEELGEGVTVERVKTVRRPGSTKSWHRLVTTVRNTTEDTATYGLRIHLAEEADKEEERARYPGEVAFADHWVGELLGELRRRGLYDDSLIVFTADHGEAFGEHGWWGHKETLYDELLHVPLIVKPPEGHSSLEALARARDRLARHVDVVPTVLEILGLPGLPGASGAALFSEEPRELEAWTTLMRDRDGVVRAREHRVSLRDEEYKLIYNLMADCFEMYHLPSDPGELVNVYEERLRERPDWRARLVTASRIALEDSLSDPLRIDPQARDQLEKLGYLDEGAETSPCE